MQPVSPAKAISFPDQAVGAVSITGRAAVLLGYWLRESTGAATATVELRTGGAAGQLLAEVALAAGESARDVFGPVGLEANSGITANVTAGTVRGGVWAVWQ